jgi:hypothetical protein
MSKGTKGRIGVVYDTAGFITTFIPLFKGIKGISNSSAAHQGMVPDGIKPLKTGEEKNVWPSATF